MRILLEEQCRQISSQSDLKRWSLKWLLWRGHPNKETRRQL